MQNTSSGRSFDRASIRSVFSRGPTTMLLQNAGQWSAISRHRLRTSVVFRNPWNFSDRWGMYKLSGTSIQQSLSAVSLSKASSA
ncbi:hypothetical protein PsYK624_035280 [Phanerochaete sordida]|uniref:Uncharacterized protein n=1 Tax=Phanerochaete sordida TaxID=48140 RepID=A0A9P3L9S4_9APHY|nr:hypothetical protein PsYK624_035280 [Phanerochaete sordida]